MHRTADQSGQHQVPSVTQSVSRRGFIGAGVAGTAALLGAAQARTPERRKKKRQRAPGVISTTGSENYDPDLVLLINRITNGFSLAEYQWAESLGYDGYLQDQLTRMPADIDAADFDATLNPRLVNYDILDKTTKQIRDMYNGQGAQSSFIALRQACSFHILLATYSEAQLHARMFEFWNNHVNIDVNHSTFMRWFMHPYNREVLRYSMDNVPALVLETARTGAMMYYLDNYLSTATLPNENYAREIMELHTLGVDNTYTQTDIEEAARVLSGWGLVTNQNSALFGDYAFTNARHDAGTKTVIGVQYGPSGNATEAEQEGLDLIAFLTAHEDTAEYISRKLCRFMLGGIGYDYNPPEDVVQYCKSIYLDTAGGTRPLGHIPSMLAAILSREVLTTYAGYDGAGNTLKFKRPLHYVTSALRATGAVMTPVATSYSDNSNQTGFALRSMGGYPFTWAAPNGPFDSQVWAEGAVLPRWAFADRLAEQVLGDTPSFNVGNLLAQVNANASGQHARGFSEVLTGGRFDQKEIDDMSAFLGANPSESRLQEGLALALQMPSFQYY